MHEMKRMQKWSSHQDDLPVSSRIGLILSLSDRAESAGITWKSSEEMEQKA